MALTLVLNWIGNSWTLITWWMLWIEYNLELFSCVTSWWIGKVFSENEFCYITACTWKATCSNYQLQKAWQSPQTAEGCLQVFFIQKISSYSFPMDIVLQVHHKVLLSVPNLTKLNIISSKFNIGVLLLVWFFTHRQAKVLLLSFKKQLQFPIGKLIWLPLFKNTEKSII